MPNTPFPVNPGSPLAAVFGGQRDSALPVPMPWSLGVLGDLMWTRLPETRPLLADRLVRTIEDAVEYGRELIPLLAGEIVTEALWWPLLKPALEAYPADRERLTGLLSVVFDAHQADGPDQNGIRYALHVYVLEYLSDPGCREIVAELHPDLAALVAREVPG